MQYGYAKSDEYPVPALNSFYAQNYFQHDENPRQAQVVISKSPLVDLADQHDYSHFRVDVLTKPQVVLFPRTKLPFIETFSPLMLKVIQNYSNEYYKNQRGFLVPIDQSFRAHVISDGRKAFISEPDILVVRFWDRKNLKALELLVKTNGSYTEKPAGE